MKILNYYGLRAPLLFVYMLQQFEYNSGKFLAWIYKYPDLKKAQQRGDLHVTNRVELMLGVAYSVYFATLIGVSFAALTQKFLLAVFGLLLLPVICLFVLVSATFILQTLIINPKQNKEIHKASQKLAKTKAVKIAVMGSYGKTSMKEFLVTIISEGQKIIATPGNKNVLISHARWVNKKVVGDESVLVFEYGEAGPGDISKLADFSKPDIAVVTGIAPAHLDCYPNMDAIAQDFASISDFVKPKDTYLNSQKLLTDNLQGIAYDAEGLEGWKVSGVKVSFAGLDFVMTSKNQKLHLHTGLLGEHQIGPISAAVVIAKKLGLTNEQISSGVAKTVPYEHRMQPRQLGGAWLIDDTYNGNIEGMKAGLKLLQTLPGKRKIYVTPGLVDQGLETETVHVKLGKLIAESNPDKAVIMQNSVTKYIQKGLKESNYKGEVEIETNPLEFYTNIEHFLASGDVILMQNDLPDSYS